MLNRYLLLFLFLTLGARPAQAQQQTLESATFKQRLRSQYLHNDTAQAIINLYSKRQVGGASWIFAAALTGARIAAAPDRTTVNGVVVRESSNAGAAFLFALPFAGYGAAKIAHYSNRHLDRILTDYGAGKPLPRALRRKLKPRFFAQPIIQYEKVKVRPAN